MIIAAVCLGKFIPSGSPINVPFGKGRDHGEAFQELLRFYDVIESRGDGFAASMDGEIVYLDREAAMKHALDCGQVKPGYERSKRLNSEMVTDWDRGRPKDLLTDIDYRMRDFYWLAKAKHNIETDYGNLPALSLTEREEILKNVAEVCGFGNICF